MPVLSISLLGSFRARLDDELIPGFQTRKVQALLIFLTAEPRKHRREHLMDLMWPGMPNRSARHNLRQVLYYLRNAIPDLHSKNGGDDEKVPFLLANRQMIRLNPDALVKVDVARFEELLHEVQSHEHINVLSCPPCLTSLEQAVELYRGDFLADFYLDDSNPFEEWAQVTREGYRRKVLDALEVLTAAASRQREFPKAQALAKRQLEIDNLRESAYRQLMEILALSGRREEALAVYENCRRLLAEELGMEPAKRTTQVAEKIMAGDLSFDTPLARGVRGYELKEEIGAGAYGSIHRAYQSTIDREVAVKVIRRKFADDPEFIRRFETEAQTVARLEHPYIVPLYDYWRDPDGAYLVMRYLKGGNLLSALESGPWNVEATARMVAQLAAALAVAHQQGIVHRDIKPANILLDESGNAYLSDFGIAQDLTGERALIGEVALLGTLDYTSPEQIQNEPVSAQSDIYSLGAVLYETLTGEKPFPDSTPANLIYKHLNDPVPLVAASRPDVPRQIDAVIQKATAKSPADRYTDALQMAEAFRLASTGRMTSSSVAVPEVLPTVAEVYNPYKGLRAFQETDADDFFGREALVQQLIDRLADSRFLALVGPSGSGKSSAVKAGLIPALREGALPGSEKWFVAEMVPGTHPLEELEMALWPVAVDPPPSLVEPMERDSRGLLRTIRRILPGEAPQGDGSQLLLVVDQFEELFTLVEDKARRAFFIDSLLQAIAAPRSPLRVVLTLRADFYDRPLVYESLGRLLKENTEVILPLTAEELTWAVREPARRVGVGPEEGLAEAIVADVADQPGALPLLQYALTELFERRHEGLMTQDAYREVGGVLGALGRRADGIYTDLDKPGQELVRQLFLRLVTLGEGVNDTRRRVPRAELESLAGQQMEAGDDSLSAEVPAQSHLHEIIEAFGQARLLTFDHDPATRQPTVEVAHEALLRQWARLREWLNESRADLRLQRQLARAASEWETAGRDAGFLIPGGARLAQFESWSRATGLALTRPETAYLQASLQAEGERQERKAREARSRRNLRRALIGALSVGLVVAIGLSIFAFSRQRAAEASEQEALRQASIGLAAQALDQLDSDTPERAVLLALEALEIFPYTAQAERALAQAVYGYHQYTSLNSPDYWAVVFNAAYSPDGTRIATAGAEQTIGIWDAASGNMVSILNRPDSQVVEDQFIWGVDWASDSSILVTASTQLSVARVWDANSGDLLLTYGEHSDAVHSAYVSDDDRFVLTASSDRTAHIWQLETGNTIQTFEGHEDAVTDAVWSPDSTQIVTGSDDGTIRLWDVNTGREQMVIEAHAGGVLAVAWSPDGSMIASAGKNGLGRIWNVNSGDSVLALIGHGDRVNDIEWSSDGTQLATASEDGTARVWDAISGGQESVLPSGGVGITNIAWSPDSQQLVWVGGLSVRLWDTSTPIIHLPGYDNSEGTPPVIGPVDWSPDSSVVLTMSQPDFTARIRNAQAGEEINRFEQEPGRNWMFGYMHPFQPLVTVPEPLRIWNYETDEVRAFTEDFSEDSVGIWSPDGQFIYLMSFGAPDYAVYDADTGERILFSTASGCDFVLPGSWSPNSHYIAHGCLSEGSTPLIVTDALTGEIVREFLGHTDGIMTPSWSPDGTRLAVGSPDNTVIVWDFQSGEILTVFTGHTDWVFNQSWSPNGSRIVSGDVIGSVRVWDTETGREVNSWNMGARITEAKWSPDGRWVITAGEFPVPEIRPVWQSTEELIQYAYDCCVFRELTAEEREQFGLPPADDVRASGAP